MWGEGVRDGGEKKESNEIGLEQTPAGGLFFVIFYLISRYMQPKGPWQRQSRCRSNGVGLFTCIYPFFPGPGQQNQSQQEVCLSVIGYVYPAACGPKGHGSSGEIFQVYPIPHPRLTLPRKIMRSPAVESRASRSAGAMFYTICELCKHVEQNVSMRPECLPRYVLPKMQPSLAFKFPPEPCCRWGAQSNLDRSRAG